MIERLWNTYLVGWVRACCRVACCPLLFLLIWTRKSRELLMNRFGDDSSPIGYSKYDSPGRLVYIISYWIFFFVMTVRGFTIPSFLGHVQIFNFVVVSLFLLFEGLDMVYNDQITTDGKSPQFESGFWLSCLGCFGALGVIYALPMVIVYILVMLVITTWVDKTMFGEYILTILIIVGAIVGVGLVIYGKVSGNMMLSYIGAYMVTATIVGLFSVPPVGMWLCEKFDFFGHLGDDVFD